MSDNVRKAAEAAFVEWWCSMAHLPDERQGDIGRGFAAGYRAALAAPSAATGSVDEADRLDALRAQRSVVTRNYARDPSNENEAALYAICERVYAAERKVAAATGSGAATGPRDEAVFAFGVADGRGRRTGPAYDERATAERVCREFNRDPADAFVDRVHPFTVVALVPQRQQGGAR